MVLCILSCTTCWRSALMSSPPTAVGHHVGLDLLQLEQVGREVARVLRHQQLLDDLAAVGLDDARAWPWRCCGPTRSRWSAAPSCLPLALIAFLTMACEKLVPLPSQTNLTRWQSLPDSVGELELVLRKMQPYFCATCEMALATPECTAPIRKAASLRRDHALGHARAGGRRGLGVHVDRLDAPAEHAALVVELLDGHHRAQALLAARCAVLARGVHGQADDQRLLLRGLGPGVVVRPRAEERRQP